MMKHSARLSNKDRKQLVALVDQAARACSNGRHEICLQLCKKIESIQPKNPDAANMRGIICSCKGQYAQAIQHLKQAIEVAPTRIEFAINLAGFYLITQQYESAARHYRQALKLDAKSIAAQIGLGNALIEIGQSEEAIEVLQSALRKQPKNTVILMHLSRAYYELADFEKAESSLRTTIQLNPQHADAHCSLGRLKLEAGSVDEAESEFRQTLAIDSRHVKAYANLAELKSFESTDDADITAMEAIHSQATTTPSERMTICFALGKAMDKLKEYDKAFEYYREGNGIRHRKSSYHPEFELDHLQQIIRAYASETFEHCSDLDDSTPIFIIGMPRCGSTLTEQILASHPDVGSEGEWGMFEQNLARFSTEENPLTLEQMVSQTPEQWRQIGQGFLERMKADYPKALRITDKSLNNIRFVGAIHCALPNAKIIHIRRNPLDTCLSIYKNNLLGQLFDFGCDLEELGHYYRMYLNLMQHWREVLPAGTMYELDYERLVADQETETRNLLNYCGLEWNEQCLQFNKVENLVRTASITQVRRPIYTDSLAAWKRYEKHLQPLIDILGPEYSTDYRVPG